MKITLFLLLLLAISFQSCTEDECKNTHTYFSYDPVYMTMEEANATIKAEAPRELKSPGKIYYYNDYILVNELREGVHIINNSDPNSPQNVAFINIPANVDMAIKNNILYADNLLDLVAIDISNISNPTVISRQKNVFNDPGLYQFQEGKGYIVDYLRTEMTETLDCNDRNFGSQRFWVENTLFISADMANASVGSTGSSSSGSAPSVGIGGSMARFTLFSDYLYTVDSRDLHVYDVSNAGQPQKGGVVEVGWGIETIYPYQDKLFVGSESGMFIFDNSNPASPLKTAEFQHWRACDPVVVEGNTAYVTLRGGTRCDGFNNQLDAIDVSDIYNPKLIRTYPMDHPYGLSIRNSTLYVCDGESGLRVYDANNPADIKYRDLVQGFDTYDAISVTDKLLIVIGKDGLYQFDTSDKSALKELSKIPVDRP